MPVNLSKGENVSLAQQVPGLNSVLVGLGWDPPGTGEKWDLDASVFLLNSGGKVVSDSHLIFYNHLTSPDGCQCSGEHKCGSPRGYVLHTGDNKDGEGDGDDEAVIVNLTALPADVQSIVFAVTIHEAAALGQNFGQVENAFIRIVERKAGDSWDGATGPEIVRYDLGEDFSTETALVFGELSRASGEWKFAASGTSPAGDLGGLCRVYGVAV